MLRRLYREKRKGIASCPFLSGCSSVIAMYFEDHNPPHFHILANDGREAQVRLGSLQVLNGEVDKRALAEAREWARRNEAFLKETWDEFSRG